MNIETTPPQPRTADPLVACIGELAARFSQLFAQYQSLAATNRFLTALEVAPGEGAGEKERERFNYGPPKVSERQYRSRP